MIKRIYLCNVATYDQNGSSLEDLNKINFIYGANGSGKTTISNYLANPQEPQFSDCKIVWQHDTPFEILVYNKSFRVNNFGNDAIDGIFTLGSATKEDIELIEKKQQELENIKENRLKIKQTLDKQKDKLQKKEEEFIEWSWVSIYKKLENDFKEAFRGFLNKKPFNDKLLQEWKNNSSSLLSLEELTRKSRTVFGKNLKQLPLISETNNKSEIIQIENHDIWSKKIIGKEDVDIAHLIEKLNLSDWVNQGRRFLQEDSNICPFCQQETITDEFRKKLDDYFDETFAESMKLLEDLSDRYKQLSESLINQLTTIFDTQKKEPVSKLDLDKFEPYIETLKSVFQSNKQSIESKRVEPSRSIELQNTSELLKQIQQLIDQANQEINEYNETIQNIDAEKSKLTGEIWKFIIEEYKTEIHKFQKEINGLKKGIKNLEQNYETKRREWSELNIEIQELNKNVTSVQPTVDEINRLLSFYGFTNFQIVPSKDDPNKYQIKREDGSLASSTLSEGEVTFITFLYYYQLTKGAKHKEGIGTNRVLVIDDPISSLDSNVLFVVSSLIKNLIKDIHEERGNIKQLIVLTHNVYFHKEISFIDSRTRELKDIYYWIIKKANNISTIYSYGMKNPIQTSYQLLWKELIEMQEGSASLATIQNVMRRIIENYFKILGDYSDEEIIKAFTTQEEQLICKSLISWINDGSHSVHDDLYIESPERSVETYLSVFEKIFEVTGHSAHYEMMMKTEEGN
jgi:wobble nucleotide-excising tRNase